MYPYQDNQSSLPCSSYQREPDWTCEVTHCDRTKLPQACATQLNHTQADQRYQINQPQKFFADQNRPSVIKTVKKNFTGNTIDQDVVSPIDKSETIEFFSEASNTADLISKYVHKKFSLKNPCGERQTSAPPPSDRSSVIVGSSSNFSLSTAFSEIFKQGQEDSQEEEDYLGNSVELDDLELVGHADIRDICLTYLAEEVPYMEERKSVFLNAWYEINIGESLVTKWIAFARNWTPLPPHFHRMTHGQLM